MRSTVKYALIVRHPQGKGTATYPVSIHTNAKTAVACRTALSAALKADDQETVKTLAPSLKLTEEGLFPAEVKFAVVSLPYEPEVPSTPATDESFEL